MFVSSAIPSKLDEVGVLELVKGPIRPSQCPYLEMAVDRPAIQLSDRYGV